MSGNWSFDSNYHPFSQSRKMSIGVMADSSAKMKAKNIKGDVAELQTSENVTLAKDIPAESKQNGKKVMSPDSRRKNKALHQETSPLVCTETSHQNMSRSDAIDHPRKVASLPSTSNSTLPPSGSEIVGETQPVISSANQIFNLHTRDANEKKSMKNTYQREGGNHGIMGREEDSPHATAQKVLMPEKGITEQGTSERGNNGNVTLRMKVQELLGTVDSPNKKQYISPTFAMDANKLEPKSKTNKNDSLVATHRQHLGKRETNSGRLDDKIRRPVTRSFTCKKPQAQKSAPKSQALFCQHKQACIDENEFSFVENWSRRLSTNVNHAPAMCKRKEREISGTKPVKKCFLEADHRDKSLQATDGGKAKTAAKNVSLLENRTEDCEMVKPNTEMKEKVPRRYEVIMTRYPPGGYNEPLSFNKVDQESFAKHTLMSHVDPKYDLKSPTFELKTTKEISSPRSFFQAHQEDLDVDSPAERASKTKGMHSFHSKGFPKGGHYNANTKNISTDLQDSPVIKSASLIIGGRKENRCSRSSSKKVQSESSEDVSPVTVPIILENREGNRWSTSPCEEEDSESSEDGSPIKGNGDHDQFHDSSEQDGLAGAVKLFVLALERIQSKIHSTTRRQSAEILLSVSKNIHSELQNAESKIQNEVAKLTNLGKSKRMRPENQFQEQQEQLKCIYEKFKEEVDQHLENCRSILEGQEAHQIKVRGMVEKQRLSHTKLLLQTEQVIETQLDDAQRRLAGVHRLAREKLLKLKHGIGECLKEGLLG